MGDKTENRPVYCKMAVRKKLFFFPAQEKEGEKIDLNNLSDRWIDERVEF